MHAGTGPKRWRFPYASTLYSAKQVLMMRPIRMDRATETETEKQPFALATSPTQGIPRSRFLSFDQNMVSMAYGSVLFLLLR
jgi:hypothetical protein